MFCGSVNSSAVLFKLFSEAEPFAAILIAHRTLGGTPKGSKFEAEGQERGGFLRRGHFPPARGSGGVL